MEMATTKMQRLGYLRSSFLVNVQLHGDVSPLDCDVYVHGIEVEFAFSYGSPHGQSHLKNPLMKVYVNDVHHW